ncbi:YheC/YheD family protein [Ferviditalea candida]|uniref:YheC/YheD family protein n=1 Tax=Ferviditalea candida TaxID=3108399 RepID=A0ABU5ZK64_9BACL|nr:YheC/YheD family protein [Paenibacillaceae bacterium T2]
MQVASKGNGKYEVHAGTLKSTIDGRNEAYSYVHSKTRGRAYIVQQKIHLAKVGGRPFDVRVMVQRKRNSSVWVVTGKLAKIAGPGYIITNTARSKGRVEQLATAIRKYYGYLNTVGLDMGVDVNGRVWIIETNFAPMISLFYRLRDKTMYRRIQSYSRG